jgi:hypothetical protein
MRRVAAFVATVLTVAAQDWSIRHLFTRLTNLQSVRDHAD